MIKLLRCDDRLIHGQCMTSIVKQHDIKKIIVIDDFTANNKMLKRVFMTAVPKTMACSVVTKADSIAEITDAMGNNVNTLVLMRVPSIMVDIYKQIPDLQKDYNIANVAAEGGTINVTSYSRFNEKELDAVKELDAMGVHIWFNQVPGTAVTEWNSIKSKF